MLLQLALKLHPDKNKARGADEAFKGRSRSPSGTRNEEKEEERKEIQKTREM
jgi:DnaJ-class molecular chaperone